jgi:hypothetical protein
MKLPPCAASHLRLIARGASAERTECSIERDRGLAVAEERSDLPETGPTVKPNTLWERSLHMVQPLYIIRQDMTNARSLGMNAPQGWAFVILGPPPPHLWGARVA